MKKVIILLGILAVASVFQSCEKEVTPQPPTSLTGGSNCVAVQCIATAKSTGNRCKNRTTNCNGRCHNHQ